LAHNIGQLARLACIWEVTARKAGNVCPDHEFSDLTVSDFLHSADAIAPVLDIAPTQPLGVTILRCIEETRKVVHTNTNLGIVLSLAPLASVPLDQPFESGVAEVLRRTTVEDSRNVYTAIRLAKPGGLGTASQQDINDEPTLPLREVMALAADRDLVAAQIANDYSFVFFLANELDQYAKHFGCVEKAIVAIQLSTLCSVNDSLIQRKLGMEEAKRIKSCAGEIRNRGLDSPAFRKSYVDFDAFLRSDNHVRNPGTTADLIAAALFVALREKRIAPDAPFIWADHPME
jgi:triphosphoribosyl-dephospho-CoA synthase